MVSTVLDLLPLVGGAEHAPAWPGFGAGVLSLFSGFGYLLGTPAVWPLAAVPVLIALGLLNGVAMAFNTPAWQVLTPRLVPREELHSAIALQGMQFNLARVVGPALAGLMLAQTSATVLFGLNTISFVAVLTTSSLRCTEVRPCAQARLGGQCVGAGVAAQAEPLQPDPAARGEAGEQGHPDLLGLQGVGSEHRPRDMSTRRTIDFKLYLTRPAAPDAACEVALLPTPEVGESMGPVTIPAADAPAADAPKP